MDDRLQRERVFHDARFGEDSRARPADRYYAINAASTRFFRETMEEATPGARFLDYGCGEAADCALHAARIGHDVIAVDISPVAIDQARERAQRAGVADRIDFKVMNAEELELPDNSFDVVTGLGVIHHLDIESSMREVARVLKPEGYAVFVEPLGHNPAINLFRRRTPEQRTADEHPLVVDDFELMRHHFGRLETTYFHLLGLLALPLRGRSFFDDSVRVLDAADRSLFRRIKATRRYAWMVGLRLARPQRAV